MFFFLFSQIIRILRANIFVGMLTTHPITHIKYTGLTGNKIIVPLDVTVPPGEFQFFYGLSVQFFAMMEIACLFNKMGATIPGKD